MFTINNFKFGNLSATKIKNTTTGIELDIIHQFGGVINKYVVNNSPFSFIKGYDSYTELIESNPFYSRSAKLFPFPNRLENAKFSYQSAEYLLPANFPWSDDAVHGLLYNQPFSVIDSFCNSKSAEVVLRYESSNLHSGFPFGFAMDISYKIDYEGKLTCTTTIKNIGDQSFIFGDAWHPYFSLGCTLDDVLFTMPACQELITESGLPTGARATFNQFEHGTALADVSLNNCFEFDSSQPIHLQLERADKTAVLHYQQEPNYPFIQLYTPPSEPTIAIEPMTCPANAFNNHIGILELQPERSLSFQWQCQGRYIEHP